MNVVWWFAGLFATVYAIKILFKFMHKVYKRLTDEDRIDTMLDKAEEGMDHAADKVAGYWKRKKAEKERPIVTIR